jgi:plastocyanin
MEILDRIGARGLALAAAGAIVAFACAAPQSTTPDSASAAPKPAVTVEQSSAPSAPKPGASTAPGLPQPGAGPNLLAKNWSERLGVTVSELKAATGKALLDPKPGDLYFFSNSSTAWGATNTKNAVWVIDAKTKKTVLEVAPFDGEKNSSHGLALSSDGKYVYLPMLGADNHVDVLDGRTFEVVQTIRTLGRPHHWKLWEDPVTKKAYVVVEDFNWNFTGSGFYVFDPSQGNAVVGGLSNGDFQGNPYVSTPSPDGKYIYMTVPAPMSSFRDKMDGYFGKIDPKTWKVVGIVPMIDPLWAEISLDGKFGYVTSGGQGRIYKIDLATMTEVGEVQTGPGPWGARISYDQTKIYTADKGEGPGYNQQGRTSTIIDLQTMGVQKVVDIGLTTDHAILSPDGVEVWFTSNAEHSIYVYDTKTDTLKTIVKDPADGDIHGGVFVQYKSDGRGGVVGEVVADYSGLHGTALKTQIDYVASPSLTIAIGRSGFMNKTLTAPTGQNLRVTIKNVGSTGTGKVTFESEAMGIKQITLEPGKSTEIRWTSPTQTGDVAAKTDKTPDTGLTIKVAPPAQPQQQTGPTGPRELQISTKGLAFEQKTLEVKAGETVKITLVNGDDEKHNLVSLGGGNLLSPDIAGGRTGSFSYTAPSSPGTYKVICAYHPQMTFDLVIK